MIKSNVFKKISAAILSLSMVLSFVPVMTYAEDTTALLEDYEIELLEKLNIVEEGAESKFSEQLTRSDFAGMLVSLLGIGGTGDPLEILRQLGIVNGYTDGSLEGDRAVTLYEAVKMVMCALGYGTMAEMEGGYPLGYFNLGYRIELLEGTMSDGDITYGEGLKLIFRAGIVPAAEVITQTPTGSVQMGGHTMFYDRFKVVKHEGIVTADGFTSLDGRDCAKGDIRIGSSTVLGAADKDASSYLGYYVEAYCKDDSLKDEIISIGKSTKYNNDVTVKEGTQVDTIGNSIASFQYQYYDENGKRNKISVYQPYVVKNGKKFGGLSLAYLKSSVADVTFIDNNDDDVYDVIIVSDYETYVVESIDAQKLKIFAKYNKTLELDPDTYDVYYYTSTGEASSFEDISVDSAISVMMSEDGRIRKIFLDCDSISGTIDGVTIEEGVTYLSIGGTRYPISQDFIDNADPDKYNYKIGDSIVGFTNPKGRIVEMEKGEAEWQYGYIYKSVYDPKAETNLTAIIYNQSGKHEEVKYGERIIIDGQLYKNAEINNAGNLYSTSYKVSPQVIKYKLNGQTLVNVNTTYQGANEEVDNWNTTPHEMASGVYNRAPGVWFSDIPGYPAIILDPKAFLFRVPTAGNETERHLYTVTQASKYTSGSGSSVSAMKIYGYDTTTGQGEAFSYTVSPENRAQITDKTWILVKRTGQALNQNGEVARTVEGINLFTGDEYSGTAATDNTYSTSMDLKLAGVRFGDFVIYRTIKHQTEGTVMWSTASAKTNVSAVYDSNKQCVRIGAARTFNPYTGAFAGSELDLNVDAFDLVNNAWVYSSKTNPNPVKVMEADGVTVKYYDFATINQQYDCTRNVYMGVITDVTDTHFTINNYKAQLTGDLTDDTIYPFLFESAKIFIVDYMEKTIEEVDSSRLKSFEWINNPDHRVLVNQATGSVTSIVIYNNFSYR